MKVAYFDCFAGVAGDMTLAALGDLGVDGFRLHAEPVERQGIGATRVEVEVTGPQPARHLGHIEAILDGGRLGDAVRERARRVFRRLTEAEARVHRLAVEEVHLHEVGALDAIVDVVGCCLGLELLGVERVVASPVVLGSGMVRGAHGPIPVPGPATLELLRDRPVLGGPVAAEMTTPTGAALVSTLAERFGPLPAMRLLATGYGAGSRDHEELPNLLRLVVGESVDGGGEPVEDERAVLVETNLDDLEPQVLGWVTERLLEAGALDVWVTPVVMKKGRPGHVLALLAAPGQAGPLADLVLGETSAIGVRFRPVARRVLERRHEEVETAHGRVRIKVASRAGVVRNAAPEYDDCAALARAAGVPLREVQRAAMDAWRRGR